MFMLFVNGPKDPWPWPRVLWPWPRVLLLPGAGLLETPPRWHATIYYIQVSLYINDINVDARVPPANIQDLPTPLITESWPKQYRKNMLSNS